ncbi:MAG: glycosyltransferase family 87 protein [Gemmatimonadota bacterium]
MTPSNRSRASGDPGERGPVPLPVWVPWAALAAALASMLAFGVVGLTRWNPILIDFDAFYVGGHVWASGGNPYLPSDFGPAFQRLLGRATETAVLYYPPQAAPAFMALAALPLRVSGALYTCLNVVAVAGVGALAARMVWRSTSNTRNVLPEVWVLLPALALALPETWTAEHLGQVTAFVGVALYGAWIAYRTERWVLSGVLFGLVTIKPQLALLPLFWLVCDRQWRILGVTAVTVLLLALYPLITAGPLETGRTWLAALAAYAELGGANALGHPRILGIPSVIAALGGPRISPFLAAGVAAILMALLYAYRARFVEDDLFALIVGTQIALVYGRDHEVLLLLCLAGSWWRHGRDRPAVWVLAALAIFLLAVPERAIALAGWPPLLHWRTLVLGACLLLLVRESWRARARPRAAAAV